MSGPDRPQGVGARGQRGKDELTLAVRQRDQAPAADSLAEDRDEGAGHGRALGALHPADEPASVLGARDRGENRRSDDHGPPEAAAETQRAVLPSD